MLADERKFVDILPMNRNIESHIGREELMRVEGGKVRRRRMKDRGRGGWKGAAEEDEGSW